MTLRLSRRLPGLLLAASIVYLVATNSEVVWLYGLTALLLALLPVGLVAPLVAVRRLRVSPTRVTSTGFVPPLAQDRGKIFDGDTVAVRLECTGNMAACRFVNVKLRAPLRTDRSATVTPVDSETDSGIELGLAAEGRGVAHLDAVLVSSSWPLGILEARRWVPLATSYTVHPRYVLPPAETETGAQEMLGEASMRGPGEEFIGLREYQPGDSQRRVHWPTTARAGTLMVVETAVESRSPARYRVEVPPSASESAADLAATVAASLAAGSVAAGRPFRLEIPAAAHVTSRWRDALATLATMARGASAAVAGDAIVIAAGPAGVTVETPGGSRWLPADASLDDVAEALGRRQEQALP
ncbi:MAG: DUF58 domain-containing protein [Candidatus Dormiibacterota bacterium]